MKGAPLPSPQVVASYKKEGVPPPVNNEIDVKQRSKITKLVQDYLEVFKVTK